MPGISSIEQMFTVIVHRDGERWLGVVKEIPGVNYFQDDI